MRQRFHDYASAEADGSGDAIIRFQNTKLYRWVINRIGVTASQGEASFYVDAIAPENLIEGGVPADINSDDITTEIELWPGQSFIGRVTGAVAAERCTVNIRGYYAR